MSFRTARRRDTASAADGYLPLRLTPELLTDEDADRMRQIFRARP